MAMGMLLQIEGGTAELYDSFNREMGIDRDNLPAGLISHYAGETEDGWLVFDVWKSREDFERFAENQLMPAARKLVGEGAAMEPLFVEIHSELHSRARV